MKLSNADLRMIALIAEQGGITAAARVLRVQKSTVSRDLALLEDRLGQRLFERSTRRLRPTEAGEILLGYARRVVEELDAAESALEALSAEPAGDLRVSMPHGFAQQVIVRMLPTFSARYPKIRIGIDLSARYVDLLEDGIDVAIRIGELPSSSLIARRLGVVVMIMVAAPSYLADRPAPAKAADLSGHTILGLGSRPGRTVWRIMSNASTEEVPLEAAIAVQDVDILRELALRGMGIATVPESFVRQDIADGRLVRVLPAYTRGEPPLHAIYPSRRLLTPKVRVFVDAVAEAVYVDRITPELVS